MKTLICMYANYNEVYLTYAVIAIRSLITRGNVHPHDIWFEIPEKWKSRPECKAIEGMGVCLMWRDRRDPDSRYGVVEEAFRDGFIATGDDSDLILAIDTDVALTQDCRFLDVIPKLIEGADMATYTYKNEGAQNQIHARNFLYQPRFRAHCGDHGDPHSEHRLKAMIQGLFGLSLEDYKAATANETWYHGGFTIVRRRLLSKPIWKSMLAMSYITGCDETIIAMARACNTHTPLFFREIPQEPFPHRVCPPAFDLVRGPGMIHYASAPYRKKHAGAIAAEYDSIVRNLT